MVQAAQEFQNQHIRFAKPDVVPFSKTEIKDWGFVPRNGKAIWSEEELLLLHQHFKDLYEDVAMLWHNTRRNNHEEGQ